VLHLQLVVPADCSDAVVGFLTDDARVTNVVVMPGAAKDPVGDAVLCDVAREAASSVLDTLRQKGLHHAGGITIAEIAAAPSKNAERVEQAAPGSPDDGVVWDIVEERAQEGAHSSWSFYAFLTLATMIAGVAVILDQPILVVGAMVVGPEFAAVAGVATGIALRRPALALHSLRLLVLGFAVAIALTAVAALAARAGGWVDTSSITASRPATNFIYAPDHWSFVVALLAGTAGVLSLTAGRTQALVGVFISVTTVPAAGNLALALALWVPHEMLGSLQQLGVNIVGMVLAGVGVLLVQRRIWRDVPPARNP
jgi:uncharacterized hydrophobic protein (TIGR00271 family)